METCPICGKNSLRVTIETHEFWGSVEKEQVEECLNDKCGEEE